MDDHVARDAARMREEDLMELADGYLAVRLLLQRHDRGGTREGPLDREHGEIDRYRGGENSEYDERPPRALVLHRFRRRTPCAIAVALTEGSRRYLTWREGKRAAICLRRKSKTRSRSRPTVSRWAMSPRKPS